MDWWIYALAAVAVIAVLWLAARSRGRRGDSLHDEQVNRRINERLEGVDFSRPPRDDSQSPP